MPVPGNDFAALQQLIPLIVIGIFAFVIIKNVGTWISNSSQPVQNVPATVVSKRAYTYGMGGMGDMPHNTHTRYFVTFQFDDGTRVELSVNPNASGLIAEDDVGILTYQGTRFIGFQRDPSI